MSSIRPARSGDEPGGRGQEGLVEELLAVEPERFAREARALVDALPDHERGLLASALVGGHETQEESFVEIAATLGLDSTDPSLMSRADVARLLVDTQRERPETLRAALRALREQPRLIHSLGAPFAPMSDSSDTSRIAHESSDEGDRDGTG